MSLAAALAVLIKDARCEIRSRQALSAVLLFGVTSTVAVSFTLGPAGADSSICAALLWVVIYFSAMAGLGRSFIHEQDTQTASLLRLAVQSESVYLGKLAFNFLVLLALEIVVVPLFAVLMDCSLARIQVFVPMLLLGSLAISAGATTAAAMVSRASSKGALFAGISFPLLAPALAIAIRGTSTAMEGSGLAVAASDLRLLAYYSGIVITASLMLFRYIWEE